jgi:FkbM family methyltransferase
MLTRLYNLRKKNRFQNLCKSAKLSLDYNLNKSALRVLEEVFLERSYADYFPFYEQVNIVDIGAHYGYFSIFAARNTNPASRIISFEPDAVNFQKMQSNLASCQVGNVEPIHKAVSSRTGRATLYQGASMNHSILEDYSMLLPSAGQTKVHTIDLPTLMAEYQMSYIDFLKVDCEGAEYDIFLNASNETLGKIKVISMEFHDMKNEKFTGNRLVKRLEQTGFSVVKFIHQPSSMNNNYGKIIAVQS